MNLNRVVVTGLGALTPIGNNTNDYWSGLKSGQSGSDLITKFDTEKFKTRFACEIKGYDPLDFFEKKEARKMDLFTQYAIVVADEALKDSGLDLESDEKDDYGVIWGTGIGGLFTFQEEMKRFSAADGNPKSINPFFIPKMIGDISAGQISIKYGLRGMNYATVSACASSTNSIYDAFTYIRLGKAKVIVTGGSEAAVTEAGIGGFNAMRALSERNDQPKTASRPYDKTRDGFVLGEGAGALILEDYEHAITRGAKIYAEVLGGGMSADAYHLTAPHPEGVGIIKVMNNALKDANISNDKIDYINTHGTSTPLGDVGEVKAIQHVLGDHIYNINISSSKSMTGHLLGAAGAIESIASILAIEHGVVPPTINHFEDDDQIDPRINLTFHKSQERNIKIALSNTFGFGGHNFSIIFGKPEH
ncbi:MAG TPA: beta-ketoacyl-ACP synthase II [Cyclobacteriaceae bacterium]